MEASCLVGFSGGKNEGSVAVCLKIRCFQRRSINSLEVLRSKIRSKRCVFHFIILYSLCLYFALQNLCFSPLFGRNTAVTMQGTVKYIEFGYGYVKVTAIHTRKTYARFPFLIAYVRNAGRMVQRVKIAAIFGRFLVCWHIACFSFFLVSHST